MKKHAPCSLQLNALSPFYPDGNENASLNGICKLLQCCTTIAANNVVVHHALLQVGKQQRSRSSAMKVHAALQNYIQQQRALAGCDDAVILNKAQPYQQLYAAWCSKKRDRALAEEADEECECRAAVVHMSFGRDPYIKGAHNLLASADGLDARLLSMFLCQVQMVARGDDLRGRRLKDLGTRTLACVGECTAAVHGYGEARAAIHSA